eukprot:CAMPEP_0197825010 /NCGR_PEP_ID=MMETSP1437-20131217/2160_1 /TAXON_ID=49252 ORGANISM="Eucampia antarctica, Strain CCMP1452" /NCGR_SAMPLE_ID=MMETSP1437 /ASSEMBLY_ACC=CAM_ASM_001096 /LENGTH=418 /DNA_ID=CAMNT_0043424839 /DNA_START=129 /DNA_END=1382 /DNA_ORIENTATION=+
MSCICMSCCGNGSKSGTAARVRSVMLFVFAVALSFVFQYGVAPQLQRDYNIPYTGADDYLRKSWTGGCQDYATEDLRKICSGNNGVYRVTSATFLFYVVAAIISYCKPSFNRKFWILKFLIYLALVTATIFIPNDPLFTPIFINVARAVAAMFIIFQQVIIIDMAYNVNESWVQNANKAEAEDGEGAGNKWLLMLLALSGFFFLISATGIGLLYGYFLGCNSNSAFISVTLILGLLCTAVQLTGEESSLFTSMALFSYATFLCYTAVSKNPNSDCNPKLGQEDVFGSIIGIGITFLSLAWTGWSATAENRVSLARDEEPAEPEEESKITDSNEQRNIKGVVFKEEYGAMQSDEDVDAETKSKTEGVEKEQRNNLGDSWKLNLILAMVTCWFAMTLTGWGSVQIGGGTANPDVGNVSMW